MNDYFPESLTPRMILRNLALVEYSLNKVTWTLKMELLCSLMLPLCCYCEWRWRRSVFLAIVASLALALRFPTVTSVVVAPAFLLGYILPETQPLWHRLQSRRLLRWLIGLGALAIFLSARSWLTFLPWITAQ